MKFDSNDKKPIFSHSPEYGPKKNPQKTYHSYYNNKVIVNTQKIKEKEEKTQLMQNNLENLKKSLNNTTQVFVNPLKLSIQKQEEEKLLQLKALEKKKQDQQRQRLLYEEYKRKQQQNYNNISQNRQHYNNTNSYYNNKASSNVGSNTFNRNPTPTNNYYNVNNQNRNMPTNNKVFMPTGNLNIYNNNTIKNIPPTAAVKKTQTQYAKKISKKKPLISIKKNINFNWQEENNNDLQAKKNLYKRKEKISHQNSNKDKQVITITRSMTLNLLSNLIYIPIETLMKNAYDLGLEIDIHKTLTKDVLELILDANNFICNIQGTEEIFNNYINVNKKDCNEIRPPVICVAGHVDHGKTSFLDRIRETNIVDIEAGGITQNITLYQLAKYGEAIFIDTPGHSVFSVMRSVGLKLTDIIILLIAADDGIKEQTIEIIKTIQSLKTPHTIIIGITKIDKFAGDIKEKEKRISMIYNDLTKYGLVPEIYEGPIKVICISSKTNEGIKEMLQAIEVTKVNMQNHLKYQEKRSAIGIIVNAFMEKGIGIVAYILLQQGTLCSGDKFISGNISGKVRLILFPKGVKKCTPKNIIKITGFEHMPKSGDDFIVMEDEDLIKNVLLMRDSAWQVNHLQEQESLSSILNKEKIHLLLKTDTAASLEALRASVLSLSSKFIIKIFSENVGDIILSDVEKAIEFDLKIIGFNVKIENVAKQLIKNKNIKCINSNIIYRILEEMELLTQKTETIITETKVGTFEVRHLFTFNKTVIAGGKVLEGSIFHSNHYICEIFRKNVSIYKNHISSMKKGKDNMKEAKQDIEVGIMFDNFHKIEVNDQIICYKIATETKIIE